MSYYNFEINFSRSENKHCPDCRHDCSALIDGGNRYSICDAMYPETIEENGKEFDLHACPKCYEEFYVAP